MHYVTVVVIAIISFVGTSVAFAQGGELADLTKPVLDALLGGRYLYAAALGLVLGVSLLRRYGGARWPLLVSKKMSPYLVLISSFGAALATSLGAGVSVSLGMVWTALQVAIAAAGSYALLKPILVGLQSRGPAWMKPILSLVTWVFTSRSRAERARAAGDAAVTADPPKGPEIGFKDVP